MLHHMMIAVGIEPICNIENHTGVFGDDRKGGNVQLSISFHSPVTKVSKERQVKEVGSPVGINRN